MSIWTWIGGIFHGAKIKLAPIVVGILEVVKGGETSGVLPAIAKVLSPITGGLSVTINNAINANINNALAAFLGLEQLPATPTEAQLQSFGLEVLTAVEGKKATEDVKGQTNVTLGAILYTTIANTIGADKIANLKVTAGQIGIDVEESYVEWQTQEAANPPTAATATPSTTPAT